MAEELPSFIPPMLARPSHPFDSERHLFEIKWDGTRALAFIGGDDYRLKNRKNRDLTERYPEFNFLAKLPPGVILDGEIVVLHEGKPDFELLLVRERSRPLGIRQLSRQTPATYVVFDLLYRDFRSQMDLPLSERRASLTSLVESCQSKKLVLSSGIVGSGRRFYQEVCSQSLEGVVAKRLDSRYAPGKRSGAWVKIKRVQQLYCSVLGFIPKGDADFQSLVVGVEDGGRLRYAGNVGSGFDDRVRRQLAELLRKKRTDTPLLDCGIKAVWIEPGLYCRVSFLEQTRLGMLRAPVFEELMLE